MQQPSEFEVLTAFAKSTERSIEAHETPYPVPNFRVRAYPKFKRTVSISNNPERSSFFICFQDPFYKVGQSTVYSGAFIPLPVKTKSGLRIRKRTALDKLNFTSKSKANTTGNQSFDSKVVITGEMDAEIKKILFQSKIQQQILKALELDGFTVVTVNEYKIDFVPELQNTAHLGIINPSTWITDRLQVEAFLKLIENMREVIR